MALAAGDSQHQHATTLPCGDDEIIKYVFNLFKFGGVFLRITFGLQIAS